MIGNNGIQVCQVCGDDLDKGTIVYCASCNTPHHRDCWSYTRRCSTFGCGCTGCSDLPSTEDPSTDLLSPDNGSSSQTVMEIDGAGEGWLAGNRVRLSASPLRKQPGNYKKIHGLGRHGISNHSFLTPYSRLDLDTVLEKFFTYTAIALLVLAFVLLPKHGKPNWALVQLFCSISSILMFLRMFVDCTYVLDNGRRLLLYSRSIFGLTSTWKICEYSEVRSLGISAVYHQKKHSNYYTYAVVLKLPDGSCITVSADNRDFYEVDGLARSLANHLGTEYLESQMEVSSLAPTHGDFPMVPIEAEWRSWPVLGRPGIWQVVLFLFTLAATAVSFSN